MKKWLPVVIALFLALVSTTRASVTLDAGVYTPTISLISNLNDATTYPCQYMQVGNVVSVSCVIRDLGIDAAAASQFTLSLPVPSDIQSFAECAGSGTAGHLTLDPVKVLGDAANDACSFTWLAPEEATGRTASVTFTYLIS